MEQLLTILGWLIGIFAIVWIVKDQAESYIDSRKRRRLEAEIRVISDDLITDPEGLSLTDAVALLELEMLEEIVLELRKMPNGSRSLQRAIEITGDESYGKS